MPTPLTEPSDPLNPERFDALQRLVDGITADQLIWVRGYLAGFSDARQQSVTSVSAGAGAYPAPREAATTVTPSDSDVALLFGSQTGNAE